MSKGLPLVLLSYWVRLLLVVILDWLADNFVKISEIMKVLGLLDFLVVVALLLI